MPPSVFARPRYGITRIRQPVGCGIRSNAFLDSPVSLILVVLLCSQVLIESSSSVSKPFSRALSSSMANESPCISPTKLRYCSMSLIDPLVTVVVKSSIRVLRFLRYLVRKSTTFKVNHLELTYRCRLWDRQKPMLCTHVVRHT